MDTLAIGRELKADAVLEGTLQHNGERVRVTVQMLDVETGKILWGQSFDENFADIFSLQDTVSADVAQSLQVKLSNEEQKEIRKHSTENLETYQAYLRGRYFWNKRDNESLKKGIEYFEQAVKLDPNYALPFSGIADSYLVLDYYFGDAAGREENLQKARRAAAKAIELDDNLAEAHTSLAFIHFFFDDKTPSANEAAEAEFKRAIEINPNYATAHHWYSDFLAMCGRNDESLREIETAVALDPVSPIINTTLGERFFYARRYDEAINQLRRTVEMENGFSTAHYLLAMAYEQKGMFAEAIKEIQKADDLAGENAEYDAVTARLYMLSGDTKKAKKILNDLIKNNQSPHAVALVYLGLGDENHAIEWLKKLDAAKSKWFFKNDPRLDSLRSNPEFLRLSAGA